MTVRARALALEMEARQYPPAAAVNMLAVHAAKLESAVAELRDQLRQATGERIVIDGQVG